MGLREPTEKTSFNLPHSVMERLRAVAFQRRMTQTDLVIQALELLFSANVGASPGTAQPLKSESPSPAQRDLLAAVDGLSAADIQILIAFARMLKSPAAENDPDFAASFLEAFRDALRRVLPPMPSKADMERVLKAREKGRKGA